MLNIPVELRCIVISHLRVPSFCRLRESCKWFSQDELWDVYLKGMHTKSKCIDDSKSSSKDKIKYIYQTRNVQLPSDQSLPTDIIYALSDINNYEMQHDIQLPLDVKAKLIERPVHEHMIAIDFNSTPVIKSNGDIEIRY